MRGAKLFWIFIFSSTIGFLIENGYRFLMTNELVWHKGVLVGPFLPIYGIGACVFVLLFQKVQSSIKLFVFGAIAGGATEFFSSLIKDLLLGIKLWDYSHHPFNLSGRISLIYLLFWGALCVFFMKLIYPRLLYVIEKCDLLHKKRLTKLCFLLFSLNLTVSGFALERWNERQSGEAAKNQLEQKIDQHFPDGVVEKVYPSVEQSN